MTWSYVWSEDAYQAPQAKAPTETLPVVTLVNPLCKCGGELTDGATQCRACRHRRQAALCVGCMRRPKADGNCGRRRCREVKR